LTELSIKSGPVAQLRPMTSISGNDSSVVNAAAMSVPGSMVPLRSTVTDTISGSLTPASFITSIAVMTTAFA